MFYEISYNLILRNNTIRGNTWVKGQQFTGNKSVNYCTRLVPTTSHCAQPGIATPPLYNDCRWKTQQVDIHNNSFAFDPASIPGCSANPNCGRMAILSNYGTYPDWSPYHGTVIQDAITFHQGNAWHNNIYTGPWAFTPYDTARLIGATAWQAAPYAQDAGSSFAATTTPNLLDPDTATLEGGLGHWIPWYSAAIAASTDQQHSGLASLKITATAPFGWGAELNNWPGIVVSGGPRTISFWSRAGSADTVGTTPTLLARGKDSAGNDLLVTSLASPALAQTWQQATTSVNIPAGTTSVYLQLIGNSPKDSYAYFDDFYLG